jgi:hypothetical protein
MIIVKMSNLKPEQRADFFCYVGVLEIGTVELRFSILLSHWSIHDYLDQWEKGVERIKTYEKSCLITDVEKAQFINKEKYSAQLSWLALYKKNDKVIIQKLRFLEEVYNEHIGENNIITKQNCYNFVPEYNPYYPIYPSLPKVFWELNTQELTTKFSIKITDDTVNNLYRLPVVMGLTCIGSYTQKYKIPINYWSINDYKEQWQEGINRLQNYPSSCLITRISEPMGTIGRWLLYKRDDKIIFYYDYFYGVYYSEEIGEDTLLTKKNCYDFIPDEQAHLEKYRVEEEIADLKEFDYLKVVWPDK